MFSTAPFMSPVRKPRGEPVVPNAPLRRKSHDDVQQQHTVRPFPTQSIEACATELEQHACQLRDGYTIMSSDMKWSTVDASQPDGFYPTRAAAQAQLELLTRTEHTWIMFKTLRPCACARSVSTTTQL